MSTQHVLINGAGLAGLSLAIALAKRNIQSMLFEIRPVPTTIGGTITLAPNALRVLDQTIGVYGRIRKAGFEYEHIEFYAEDGLRLGGVVNGDRKMYGYPALRISRPILVEALLKCANDYSNLINIRWSSSINKIFESNAGVEVTLQNGNTANGDILVGTDGVDSKIREYVLGNRAPTPIYTGQYSLSGSVERSEIDWRDFKIPAFVYSQRGALLLFPYTSDTSQIV